METKLTQPVYNTGGEEVGEVALPEIFSRPINRTLMSQVVVAMQKNARAPIAHTKGRSEVRGGGRKPWRQKGTGRARHGSIRSPIWKGGGVTYGPTKERLFKVKVNKKARQGALAMALADKIRTGEIRVLDNFGEVIPTKTKQLAALLDLVIPTRARSQRTLVISASTKETLKRASRNLPGVVVKPASEVNVLDVLAARTIVLAKDAIEILSTRLESK